jgi:hypothetical protein
MLLLTQMIWVCVIACVIAWKSSNALSGVNRTTLRQVQDADQQYHAEHDKRLSVLTRQSNTIAAGRLLVDKVDGTATTFSELSMTRVSAMAKHFRMDPTRKVGDVERLASAPILDPEYSQHQRTGSSWRS